MNKKNKYIEVKYGIANLRVVAESNVLDVGEAGAQSDLR